MNANANADAATTPEACGEIAVTNQLVDGVKRHVEQRDGRALDQHALHRRRDVDVGQRQRAVGGVDGRVAVGAPSLAKGRAPSSRRLLSVKRRIRDDDVGRVAVDGKVVHRRIGDTAQKRTAKSVGRAATRQHARGATQPAKRAADDAEIAANENRALVKHRRRELDVADEHVMRRLRAAPFVSEQELANGRALRRTDRKRQVAKAKRLRARRLDKRRRRAVERRADIAAEKRRLEVDRLRAVGGAAEQTVWRGGRTPNA